MGLIRAFLSSHGTFVMTRFIQALSVTGGEEKRIAGQRCITVVRLKRLSRSVANIRLTLPFYEYALLFSIFLIVQSQCQLETCDVVH